MENPSAILVGDLHLRDDQPVCRLDDFWATQVRKLTWLRGLWEQYGRPPVIQPGDVFHRWRSSPAVLSLALEYCPPLVTIPGNPGKHNYNGLDFSQDSLYTMSVAVVERIVLYRVPFGYGKFAVCPVPWGEEPGSYKKPSGRQVALTHRMVLDGPSAFDGEDAMGLLKRWKGYDLIVTGHNHKPIAKQHGRRWLVNPGSFTRQSAAETHEPVVFLWWASDNRVEVVPVPTEEGVVTREHIERKEEEDGRVAAFVERLGQEEWEITIQFKTNIEQALRSGAVRDSVRARVLEAIDENN